MHAGPDFPFTSYRLTWRRSSQHYVSKSWRSISINCWWGTRDWGSPRVDLSDARLISITAHEVIEVYSSALGSRAEFHVNKLSGVLLLDAHVRRCHEHCRLVQGNRLWKGFTRLNARTVNRPHRFGYLNGAALTNRYFPPSGSTVSSCGHHRFFPYEPERKYLFRPCCLYLECADL